MLQFGIKQSRYAEQKKASQSKNRQINKAKFVNNNLFVCYYGAAKYFLSLLR